MDIFKLKQNNTTVKTELNAALTTFLAMLYIVPVNALILSDAGMPKDALLVATALITIIALLSSPLPQYSPNASDGRDGPKTIKRGGIMYN